VVETTGILVATTNRGKLREVRAVLAGLPVKLTGLNEHADWPAAVEDGDTFEANAVIKARHYAALSGGYVLADDSGLEVDALGGAPGLRSARYAGEVGDTRANNAKLIEALRDVPLERRTARFRCAVALALGARVLATAHGTFEGMIVDTPAGANGFGYDPHFFVPDYHLTVAQLAPEAKNRISHRGQALRKIRPAIEALVTIDD
jgi:XTP/dITP diphosphohydrolase